MSFVLDNSIALAWCFEDEQTPSVMAQLDRVTESGATAPARQHAASALSIEVLGTPI